MKLKESIEKIKEYSKENFINSDQYKIYEKILKNINSDFDRKIVLGILLQPIKVGLTFDESPTIKTDYINILIKNNELSFNGLDKKENFLIIGENYDALLNLTLTLSNQIGVIYIDPLYNTKDLLGKKYKDKFTKMPDLIYLKKELKYQKNY